MSGQVHIHTGGPREWHASHAQCPRCFRRTSWLGWSQAWYDTVWTCLRCGAQGTNEEGVRFGSPRKDRERALWARREFTRWLIAGSPRLEGP